MSDSTNQDLSGHHIGFIIPEFPQQTHIAWWRVANAMRSFGNTVTMISTRRSPSKLQVHAVLRKEAEKTCYLWPPKFSDLISEGPAGVRSLGKGLSYICGLPESSSSEKIRLAPLALSAVSLGRYIRKEGIDFIFVHSCANSAHLASIVNRTDAIPYALRLGGDLRVYGKDHFSKMKNAKFIMSASPTYFEEITETAGVEGDRLHWCWAGVDRDKFKPAWHWPRRRDDDPLRIVTVARLNAAKGHLYTIEAISRIVREGIDIRYDLIGSGPFEREIRQRIKQGGLEENVSVVGRKDTDRVVEILQGADLFVLPSFGVGEAAPAAVCEAMACGLPVISSIIGATPYMIDDNVDGFLVEQKNSSQIYERIRQLTDDPEKLVEMKINALEKSAAFDVMRTAQKILTLMR